MKQPILYLMFGYPGAGKTTAAKIISEITSAEHLSSDKKRFDMFPNPDFSQAEHDQLYKALDNETAETLKKGKNVVYDANLNRFIHRKDKYDICEEVGAKPVLLWVKTPRELAKDRASHLSRQHLWPPNETADHMFDRIAGLIEEPNQNENYVTIDGTKINKEHIKQELEAANVL